MSTRENVQENKKKCTDEFDWSELVTRCSKNELPFGAGGDLDLLVTWAAVAIG
jgi:hypothetical protein